VDEAVVALGAASMPARSLAKRPAKDGEIQVATMHRMKGLEFRCMAVIGVSDYQMPAPSAVTPVDEDRTTHDLDVQRERCLLFVACTRAREELTVSWHGRPSALLPAEPADDRGSRRGGRSGSPTG
jgi:superfamily I DNA/RNA helicase